ncbi:MAG: hypothetical protein KGR98_12840, partial [Verrucomicrobia bacterium]|nr:hypothetical protein [Verrucomicrobiota bacterium]
ASTFSGNKHPTPRYDYNQIMYRLDLSDPCLQSVEERDGENGAESGSTMRNIPPGGKSAFVPPGSPRQ